jgi:two-component system chemotaxis response regulator CheB
MAAFTRPSSTQYGTSGYTCATGRRGDRCPGDFPATIIIVQHRPPQPGGVLTHILRACSGLRVLDGDALQPGTVYVARADSHLTIASDRTFHYHDGSRIRHVRSSANPLFESAAKVFGGHLIAVVLSGNGSDATDGVQGVKAQGGIVTTRPS